MSYCPLCKRDDLYLFYSTNRLPAFQNKVYNSRAEALTAPTGLINLVQCLTCGFVYNQSFDERLMNYDSNYQNEQNYSPFFQQYLYEIAGLLEREGFKNGRVIEIGCGKGFFLELLQKKHFEAYGFDPAYEGQNPNITKAYYGHNSSSNFPAADLIILRHTLEHIQAPFEFLKMVAETNHYHGKIFIEVPAWEWIIRKKSVLGYLP